MKKIISDTMAADTIPLKLVVYLGLLAAVVLLLAQAWNTASPALQDAEIKAQAEIASLSLLSIQGGYAQDSTDSIALKGACVPRPFLSFHLSDTSVLEWIWTGNATAT